MPIHNLENRSDRGPFWVTIAICGVLYVPSLFWSLGLDQNIFAEIAALLLKGLRPYVDAWDVKPPNIYYVYAAFQALFGKHEMAIRLADYLSTIVSCGLIYQFVKQRSDHDHHLRWVVPATSAIIFAMTMLSLGLSDTAQTESFSIPWILLAAILCHDADTKKYFLAGVAIGIATFFKTTNVIFVLPLLLEVLLQLRKKRLMRLTILLAGLALWVGIQVLVLQLEGSLQAYIHITTRVLHNHPNEVSSLTPFGVLRSLWVILDVVFIVGIAGAICAVAKQPHRDKFRFPALLFVAGIAIVWIQNKGWGYHYAIVLPGMIVLCVLGIKTLYDWLQAKSNLAANISVAALGFIFLFVSPSAHRRFHNTSDALQSIQSHEAYIASLGSQYTLYYPKGTAILSNYIVSHTTPSDEIVIMGNEPGAYWQSGRTPASPFIYGLLMTSGVIDSEAITASNLMIATKRPKLIVVETTDTTRFRTRPETSSTLLQDGVYRMPADYSIQDTVCDKFLIYSRK